MHAKSPIPPAQLIRLASLAWVALACSVVAHAADSPVLWDEPGVLAPEQKQALIALLIEHRKTTDEKIAVAILKDSGAPGIAAKSKDLFDDWKLGEGGRGMGALLVLDSATRKARWEIGLGLLPKLTDSFAVDVVKDKLVPAWKAQQLYPAIAQTLLETLRATESPLVDSGRALEILQAAGPVVYEEKWSPRTSLLAWILLGFAALGSLAIGFFTLSAAEAHFTSAGWFRPRLHLTLGRDRRAPTHLAGTQNDW